MATRDKNYQKVQLKALAKQTVGFECEFIDPPPADILQTECPVCLLVIREPHQVTCCGYSFCHSCIERIKADKKACPTCNQPKFNDFPDIKQKRLLLGLKVCCNHQKDGCEWTGELRDLHEHLNTDTDTGEQLEGCQFVEIRCTQNCGKRLRRRSIQTHQNEHCQKRQFNCKYCLVYKSTYNEVVNNHYPKCAFYPVECPNKCGSLPKRQDLGEHLNKECRLETIKCDLHFVGCTKVIPRKDMPEHLTGNLLTHLSLLAASHGQQQAQIVSLLGKNKTLEAENEKLQSKYQQVKEKSTKLEAQVAGLNTQFKTLSENTIIAPPILIMTNFSKISEEKKAWQSSPIYTRHHGYKICMRVNTYQAKGKYIGVFVHLMKGEFDDFLKWPFCEKVEIELVDQVEHQVHLKGRGTVQFDPQAFPNSCSRVMEGISPRGLGTDKFIAHSQLEPKFLKDDKLIFKIRKCLV